MFADTGNLGETNGDPDLESPKLCQIVRIARTPLTTTRQSKIKRTADASGSRPSRANRFYSSNIRHSYQKRSPM